MTDNDEMKLADGADLAVSAEYQRLAVESVPDRLNRAVLLAARKEVMNSSAAARQLTWLRPTAYAAMVALSLAVVLEFNDASIPTLLFPAEDPAIQPTIPGDAFKEAADVASEQIRDAEAAASHSIGKPEVVSDSFMDSPQIVDRTTLLPGDQHCSDELRATIATWWQCIESLESRGSSSIAEREMAALMSVFPDFAAPGKQLIEQTAE